MREIQFWAALGLVHGALSVAAMSRNAAVGGPYLATDNQATETPAPGLSTLVPCPPIEWTNTHSTPVIQIATVTMRLPGTTAYATSEITKTIPSHTVITETDTYYAWSTLTTTSVLSVTKTLSDLVKVSQTTTQTFATSNTITHTLQTTHTSVHLITSTVTFSARQSTCSSYGPSIVPDPSLCGGTDCRVEYELGSFVKWEPVPEKPPVLTEVVFVSANGTTRKNA